MASAEEMATGRHRENQEDCVNDSITRAMEAVMRASAEVSKDDWALQAKLLKAYDLLAEARREALKRAEARAA